MPRGDRTGPEGLGPRTGRGMGYCGGSSQPGFANFGFGFGGGWGRRSGGWGRGADRGWRFRNFAGGWSGWGVPVAPRMSREDEISWLESQAKGLQESLQQIQKQLDELKD